MLNEVGIVTFKEHKIRNGMCTVCGFNQVLWNNWRFFTREGCVLNRPIPKCGESYPKLIYDYKGTLTLTRER